MGLSFPGRRVEVDSGIAKKMISPFPRYFSIVSSIPFISLLKFFWRSNFCFPNSYHVTVLGEIPFVFLDRPTFERNSSPGYKHHLV